MCFKSGAGQTKEPAALYHPRFFFTGGGGAAAGAHFEKVKGQSSVSHLPRRLNPDPPHMWAGERRVPVSGSASLWKPADAVTMAP